MIYTCYSGRNVKRCPRSLKKFQLITLSFTYKPYVSVFLLWVIIKMFWFACESLYQLIAFLIGWTQRALNWIEFIKYQKWFIVYHEKSYHLLINYLHNLKKSFNYFSELNFEKRFWLNYLPLKGNGSGATVNSFIKSSILMFKKSSSLKLIN